MEKNVADRETDKNKSIFLIIVEKRPTIATLFEFLKI